MKERIKRALTTMTWADSSSSLDFNIVVTPVMGLKEMQQLVKDLWQENQTMANEFKTLAESHTSALQTNLVLADRLRDVEKVMSPWNDDYCIREHYKRVKKENDMTKNWECFCDIAYFDKWAVRDRNDKSFMATIHVSTKDEAEFIVEKFNKLDELVDLLKEINAICLN